MFPVETPWPNNQILKAFTSNPEFNSRKNVIFYRWYNASFLEVPAYYRQNCSLWSCAAEKVCLSEISYMQNLLQNLSSIQVLWGEILDDGVINNLIKKDICAPILSIPNHKFDRRLTWQVTNIKCC